MPKQKIMILSIAVLILSFNNIFSESRYSSIGAITLQAEDRVEVQREKPKETNPNDPWAIFNTDVSIKPLLRSEKQEIVYDIFSRLNPTGIDAASNNVLMPEAINELNLLCGEQGSLKTNLRTITDRTNTTFGSVVFARMLAEPTSDIDVLNKRQLFIRALLENEKLYAECEKALLNVQNAEDHLLTLWSSKNPLDNEQIKNMLYYSLKPLESLNKSPKFLEFIRGANFAAGLLPTLSFSAMAALFYRFQQYPAAAIYAGMAGFMSYKMYQMISGIERFKVTTQDFMIKTSQVVDSAEYLSYLTEDYSFTHKDQLLSLSQENKISNDLKKLLDLLKLDTFKGSPSHFSLLGRSLAAYKYMTDVKDDFIPALEAIGEIDALFSVAKLIKEHQTKKLHYCLVDFVKNSTPVLEFEKGWNPLILSDDAVSESMKFGKNNIPNLLLTGPHGSGKSSFMRETMYMVVLGQTFGVAPATSCKMTPFSKLTTYLNIKEDYAQKLSTFMAERKRVDFIRDTINNLNNGEFCFSIMDEVFKGTMEEEGAKRVYRFGSEIAKSSQSICLMATHFNYPTILERETNGKFVNFHVGLQEHSNGLFDRMFKLVSGKNEWWFNDSNKRDRFIEWLQTVAN